MPGGVGALLVRVGGGGVGGGRVRPRKGGDQPLIGGRAAVHRAGGPPPQDTPPDQCAALPEADQCKDHRTPAQRASDVAVQNVLYRNWLRGTLGSADSTTADKYGPFLYAAKTMSRGQYQCIKDSTD